MNYEGTPRHALVCHCLCYNTRNKGVELPRRNAINLNYLKIKRFMFVKNINSYETRVSRSDEIIFYFALMFRVSNRRTFLPYTILIIYI